MWTADGRWEVWWAPTGDGRCSLFVAEAGDGDAVLVLHGGPGGDFTSVLGLVHGLDDEHRLVLFDQRGSVRSPAPAETLSFDRLVEDVVDLAALVGGDRVALVGYSFGATLAAAVVDAAPALVGPVALVAPGPLRTAADGRDRQLVEEQTAARIRIETDPEWLDAAAEFGLGGDVERMHPRDRARRGRFRDAWLFTTHPDRFEQVHSGTFFSHAAGRAIWATVPETYDLVSPLLAHDQPVTVIVGDQDVVDLGAKLCRHWFPADGPVAVRVVPEAGHMMWVDEPDLTRDLLRDALAWL